MAAGTALSEPARKAVHVGAGFLALLLPWLTRWQGVGICLAAIVVNWQVLPRLTGRKLERPDDLSRGYARGIILYPIAVGMLFLLFGSRMEVVAAAWGILAFGDGFATLAGQGLGGPRLPWNPGKTVAGLLAFVGAGGAAATALYLWTAPSAAAGSVAMLCFCAAVLGALVEGVPTGIDDNITVPLMTGGFLFAMGYVQPAILRQAAGTLTFSLVAGAVVNLAISGLALATRTVKPSGAVVGFLIGLAVYTFGGWQAFVILMLFFVLATGATRVGYERKAARRIAQEDGGRRGARHAVANCGVPAFLAFMAAATPYTDVMMVALVAALATAVSDTVSSEIRAGVRPAPIPDHHLQTRPRRHRRRGERGGNPGGDPRLRPARGRRPRARADRIARMARRAGGGGRGFRRDHPGVVPRRRHTVGRQRGDELRQHAHRRAGGTGPVRPCAILTGR